MECKSEGKEKYQHSLNLLNKIKNMKDLAEMIDVVIVAEGEKFPCHRLVLAAFSPYFKAMFTCGLLECTQREVVLYDITAESVAVILHYMYHAALEISNANVQTVAMAAYFMQMEEVFQVCQKYMMAHMDASNCVGIYYFAKQIGAEDLADQSRKYLYQHFAEVSLHEEILDVEVHQLLTLIQSDDLNVSREESILDLVLRWVNHRPDQRTGHLVELLKQVRLQLVSPSFLRQALRRNTVLLCDANCIDLIQNAFKAIKTPQPHVLNLRYGMETTSLLLCIGTNASGIRSRHRNYGDASFCYDPASRKTYFISSPKYGEGLGTVCAGVVMEDNAIILAGEASASKLSRQKSKNVEIYRYHDRGNQFWEKLCTAEFRELYALGAVRNDLYVIGGQMKVKNQYLITNCVDKYSVERDAWKRVSPLPLQLACHAVVTVNDKLYVIGGWTPQMDLPDEEPDRLSNKLLRYDPSQDQWTERAPMKYSKYRFSTAVVNSEIYVLEKRIPPWMEVALIPMTGKPSLYPGLYLFTTPCRLVRPVQNLELGKEELIGTMEQLFMNVAIFEDEVLARVTTHQELFPHSLLSVIANFIPFSDHNQSPRNMYQCQMGKQTMGFPLLTFQDRSDNKLYRLQTPQSPLVRPYMYDYYDMDNYPIGTNAIVAVISYTGYDMEDAMILNKASWERGFAHGSVYKSEFIDLSEKIKQGDDSLVFGVKPGDPRVLQKLDDDGLPFIGAQLKYGDPYYSYLNLNTGEGFVTCYKSKENCVVDNIKVCSNDTGNGKFKCVCITMRVPRNPTIGDKFASRHRQKGILSRLWPVEDMPFTESRMVPDILFNPHGFPSRMTIGMLIESMAGKSTALHGLCHDATPFTFSEENSALEYFGEMLKAAGYNYYGTKRLYSGISGLELEADIFIGVVYYQRLRHMVSDKFQVRTTGARDKVTNQPIVGRNVQGGIRFGEMERDALLAHGTSFLLHDRLFNCSDRSVAHVCVKCGSLLSPLLEKPPPSWSALRNRKYNCALCNRSDTIDSVSVPYVFRYLVAELAAMNIKVKLDIV